MAEKTIRAAGGVVWRSDHDGLRIAVVHRPKYDDWSLPKGKLDPGETWAEAAVREVWEETGQQVTVGRLLGDVEYPDSARGNGQRRRKVVRYWAMEAVGGDFVPDREVDELRWISPDEATEVLTHDLDQQTVQRFLTTAG